MPGQATEVWAHEFTRRFEALATDARRRTTEGVSDLGRRLDSFPHCRLRVGDYWVIYDFDREENSLELISVGHRREIDR